MNDNRLKHKLLKILSKQYVVSGFENAENTEIGLNDDVILPLLKIPVEKYELLKMSLFEEKEVSRHNPKYKLGLYATAKGVASFNNRKYMIDNNNYIKSNIKDYVQMIIPVLSLIITILVIIKSDSKTSKETLAIEQKLELIQNNVNKLEVKIKNHPTEEKKKILNTSDLIGVESETDNKTAL